VIEDVINLELEGLREFMDKYRQWFRIVEIVEIPSNNNSLDSRLMLLQK
jgi:hypothetical protein